MKDLRLPSLDRWPRLQVAARRVNYSLSQLLERRLWFFVIADLMVVLSGVVGAAVAGARLDATFLQIVLLPSLVLGIPALAGVVAIERRSGSLDLALSVPSTERYFVRRMLPVLLFLGAQSVVILTLSLSENSGGWARIWSHEGDLLADYGRAIYQTVQLQLYLLAMVLFWAVRLRSAGGVTVAGIFTTGALWPWLSTSPRFGYQSWQTETILGLSQSWIDWLAHAVVLGLAILIFYLYARERVRRPETMLT